MLGNERTVTKAITPHMVNAGKGISSGDDFYHLSLESPEDKSEVR